MKICGHCVLCPAKNTLFIESICASPLHVLLCLFCILPSLVFVVILNVSCDFTFLLYQSIIEDPAASQRVLKSYHMMLDFWGMSLEDEKTGVIVRGDNWEERFRNLNR